MSFRPFFSAQGEGVKKLKLFNFRSYLGSFEMNLEDCFSPVVLIGSNGAGKTNLLEALSFLVPGRGLRYSRLLDIPFHSDIRYQDEKVIEMPSRWSVFAEAYRGEFMTEVGTGVMPNQKRRQVKVNGQLKKSQESLEDILSMLWITPALDRLFCSDPSSRRQFLDRLVQAFDGAHAARCSNYYKAMRQWGRLLKEGRADEKWLSSLEEVMVSTGVAIGAARLDIVERISRFLKEETDSIFPTATLEIKGFLEQTLQEKPALLAEDLFRFKIKKSRAIYADGGSFSGPHTTDLKVYYQAKNQDAALCSTGEQKALLISIILAQLKAQMKEKGVCPMLLLDEIYAHLDKKRQEALYEQVSLFPSQVWFTGTDVDLFKGLQKRAQFFNIENSTASRFRAVA